jgi:hypothetical protein
VAEDAISGALAAKVLACSMASDWGWNPSSFEAIGTVAAFAVGFLALTITMTQNRREQEDYRARHARLVSVQVLNVDMHDRGGDGAPHLRYTISITNSGPLPVQALEPVVGGRWVKHEDLRDLFGLGRSPRSTSTTRILWKLWCSEALSDLEWGAVLPRKELTVVLVLKTSTSTKTSTATKYAWTRNTIGVTFTDAEGQRWTRRLDGALRPGTALPGPAR